MFLSFSYTYIFNNSFTEKKDKEYHGKDFQVDRS